MEARGAGPLSWSRPHLPLHPGQGHLASPSSPVQGPGALLLVPPFQAHTHPQASLWVPSSPGPQSPQGQAQAQASKAVGSRCPQCNLVPGKGGEWHPLNNSWERSAWSLGGQALVSGDPAATVPWPKLLTRLPGGGGRRRHGPAVVVSPAEP